MTSLKAAVHDSAAKQISAPKTKAHRFEVEKVGNGYISKSFHKDVDSYDNPHTKKVHTSLHGAVRHMREIME